MQFYWLSQRRRGAGADECFGRTCGLAASVWSDNIRQALRYPEAIEAGAS
ncbi:hypothetical protein MJ390_08370 [Klebsiella pneumoniae]|nr:hypothetical protein MJ390_08370 [Klebsiella pneumoniae]